MNFLIFTVLFLGCILLSPMTLCSTVPIEQSDPDVLSEYKDFSYHISFHNPSEAQVGKIKSYYGKQYPDEIYEGLLVDEYDLNNDKINELFVYYGGVNCGSSGCNTEIFTFSNSKAKQVFSDSTYGNINVLNNPKSEFQDLEIVGGTQHVKDEKNLFRWNRISKNYQYQK